MVRFPVLLILYIVVLIVGLYKSVGFEEEEEEEEYFNNGMGDWEGMEDLDDAEIHMVTTNKSERTPVNVHSFGAVGDGSSDDTQAFIDAWDKACSMRNAVFLVPDGFRYLVRAVNFQGPCRKNLVIQIGGTIVAPEDPEKWDSKYPRIWLLFSQLNFASIQGGGIIDGSGRKWWASSCKRNKTNPCRGAPTALTIEKSSMFRVDDLTVQNSQQIQFTIHGSTKVRISNVQVHAPETSPNTDGIHISHSTDVMVQDCRIGTGDDCISIVSGCSNIRMKNIQCGPGHGISIGSLGQNNNKETVAGVVLDQATITGTSNGLRIKTWQGGSGYARGFLFQNVRMVNVSNPIIINQFYCDSPTTCRNQTSAVEISEIIYRNITGTSNTLKAMKFACSDVVPCRNIVLNDIDLEMISNGTNKAVTFCNSAVGFSYGHVQPGADCLNAVNCTCRHTTIGTDPKLDIGAGRHPQDEVVHTEL